MQSSGRMRRRALLSWSVGAALAAGGVRSAAAATMVGGTYQRPPGTRR